MIFLKNYLDFSYKYRLLVGDKLNGGHKISYLENLPQNGCS